VTVWPEPPPLTGRLVTLEPLTPDHGALLLPSASDPEVWRWKLTPRPDTVEQVQAIIAGALLVGPDGVPRQSFLVRRLTDRAAIGSTTLYDLNPTHRCVENGETWLDRSCWGQGYNTDMKQVILQYCFEVLGMARVAWRVDHLNIRSQNALRRLGAVYEGTFRSHRERPDGSRRDSVYFSLLAEEWQRASQHIGLLLDQVAPPPHAASEQTALDVARAYHDAWEDRSYETAWALLDATLTVDVPINSYASKADFIEAARWTREAATSVTRPAEFGAEQQAVLIYDMSLPVGTLRIAECFRVENGRITAITYIHDTAALRDPAAAHTPAGQR
jgi:N-acetyltransferase